MLGQKRSELHHELIDAPAMDVIERIGELAHLTE